jgi:hypothetical protein
MSAWVKATVDNTRDEIIYLNLDLAVRIERPPNRGYTAIQFVSGDGSQPTVKETPDELFAQLKAAHAASTMQQKIQSRLDKE